MGRVLLSIFLGFLSLFVGFMGGELVEVPGQNPIRERVAAGLAVGLYLAVCQFLVAPKGSRKLGAKWPTMVAMAAPLLAGCLLVVALEGGQAWVFSAGPVLISGCLGIVVGAVVAGRTLPAVSLKFCRRALLTCAALLVAVALVVAAGVVPLTKADTFPLAQRAVPVFWGIVVLNVLVALVFLAIRATDRRVLSPAGLVLLAFLTLVLACFLTGPAFALAHGPAMRTASILLLLCSAAEFVVVGLLSVTALLLERSGSLGLCACRPSKT